jgi:hypothetical protein
MDSPGNPGKNLPKQIWGRKDKGLNPDVRAWKEEILIAAPPLGADQKGQPLTIQNFELTR